MAPERAALRHVRPHVCRAPPLPTQAMGPAHGCAARGGACGVRHMRATLSPCRLLRPLTRGTPGGRGPLWPAGWPCHPPRCPARAAPGRIRTPRRAAGWAAAGSPLQSCAGAAGGAGSSTSGRTAVGASVFALSCLHRPCGTPSAARLLACASARMRAQPQRAQRAKHGVAQAVLPQAHLRETALSTS